MQRLLGPKARQRWRKRWRALPGALRAGIAITAVAALCVAVNIGYHVLRKPTELLFPLDPALHKTPAETWASYGALFRAHATSIMRPELLAALAQVEGSGNPVARTYWRFRLSSDPLQIYRPASSAVGMFQITDGTFEEASRYCIRDNRVAERGAWNDPRACWFNDLYFRVLPGDAIELTSAYLDSRVRATLARNGLRGVPLARQQELAALIHLCGAGAGNAWVRRGMRFGPGDSCGDHVAQAYVSRVRSMQKVFERLAKGDPA